MSIRISIIIPVYNAEDTIVDCLDSLAGQTIDKVDFEVICIDDGSTDQTADAAYEAGADHVISLHRNRGLAAAFQIGLDASLRLGADIIVNTDGDGQYPGDQIPQLVDPILSSHADLVIGNRQVDTVDHFSFQKRWLQKFGSWIVRIASGTNVPDAPSGFRAYTRETALRLFVVSDFSYTIDNLIQAGKRRLSVTHVPIRTQPTRPSRLHRGNWNFIKRQAATIVRTYATYEPLKTFFWISIPFFTISFSLFIRLTYIFIREGFNLPGHVQSLVVASVAMIVGFLVIMFGLIADRIGDNRRLMDEILYRIRNQESDNKSDR